MINAVYVVHIYWGSELYKELDRGDGVCKYLEGNLCSIYDRRPLLCRVDECYKRFFSSEMTREEYYKKNYEGCLKLKQLYGNKED